MDYENRDKFYALANRLDADNPAKYRQIIDNLRGLEYDDFANTMFAMPKAQMAADLEAVGLSKDAQDVRDGEYDQ